MPLKPLRVACDARPCPACGIEAACANCCHAQPPFPQVLTCMRFSGYCTLVIAITVAGFAIAQPANPVDNHTSCTAEKADVEKRMEVARSKGQMLLRRQLADQLAALQSSCQPLAVDQGHTANIERLEKEVRALRAVAQAERRSKSLDGEWTAGAAPGAADSASRCGLRDFHARWQP